MYLAPGMTDMPKFTMPALIALQPQHLLLFLHELHRHLRLTFSQVHILLVATIVLVRARPRRDQRVDDGSSYRCRTDARLFVVGAAVAV